MKKVFQFKSGTAKTAEICGFHGFFRQGVPMCSNLPGAKSVGVPVVPHSL